MESAILSLFVKHLCSDAVLDFGKSLSYRLLDSGKDRRALAVLLLFLFASVTRHYQRQGHGLGGSFELTYMATLTLFS